MRPAHIIAQELRELTEKVAPASLQDKASALSAFHVDGQEAIHEYAAIVAGFYYGNPHKERILALREELRDAMEFERLYGVVAVRFTSDKTGEDYIEGLTLPQARRWVLEQMNRFRPAGPLRWDDSGLVCEAEDFWTDGENDAIGNIARARAEIFRRASDKPRGVRE